VKKPGRGQPPRGKSRGTQTPAGRPPVVAEPPAVAPAAAASGSTARSPVPPSALPPSPAARPTSVIDRLLAALPLAALVVVAAFAVRRLDDFDTWWHLASGRWIVRNGSIPDHDVLSFTVPQNEWINLQWLYDVLLYGVYQLGGDSALVVASAACFVATFALLARHLGRYTGVLTTTLLLVWVAATVNERFLIRPEMASFPLLAAIQLVLAEGRANAKRLRWLVPLMILWANMHSLFILGIGAIVCAMAGAVVAGLPVLPAGWRRDSEWPAAARRDLFVWGGAAIAATLVNPYFLRALLFPIELMTRIDGSSPVYGVIGEFRPPFSGYFLTFALGSYQVFVFTFVGLAVLAGLVRAFASERRAAPVTAEPAGRFDVGAVAFALALAYLSLLARRNVGIFAIGAVPLVAACAGVLLAKLPRAAFAPAVVRSGAALVVAGAAAIGVSVATNDWYARTGETHEFGLGTFESNFQARAVEFFREQKLPGPMFNDMTAGGYLTWDDPTGKGVYVDGRLEVYDTAFFGAYLQSLSNLQLWRRDADARGIQSVMVFHRWSNRQPFVRALIQTQEWKLVYHDETVVILVRAAGNAEKIALARDAFATTWRKRTADALGAPSTASWQWPIDRYTGQIAYARLLESIGEPAEALTWFEKAIAGGLPKDYEVETRNRVAQYYAQARQFSQARLHLERSAAVDPDNADTREMLARLDAIAK
jgi:tetratricopeptide (TPR) repeat protein